MTTVVKIMVDEAQPPGTVKVSPRIVVASLNDEDELQTALGDEHKTVFCPSVEVAEQVRQTISETEGLREL
jgi:hypothetical protein